jgi:predicted dithiol-disulfide oxidoreductase (DUF899 family)
MRSCRIRNGSRRARIFLVKEKEFTRLRDELSQKRRELPWEEVTKNYVFEGPEGKPSLADLFEGRSQFAVYHFMLTPRPGVTACASVSTAATAMAV